MRHIRWLIVLLLLLPAAARAQVTSGADILRGLDREWPDVKRHLTTGLLLRRE